MGVVKGHGTTIAWETGFFATILGISLGGVERAAVLTSHFGTTNYKTFEPADLTDPGEITVEIQHDTAKAPPVLEAAETLTITWPDSQTLACSGFMTGYEFSAVDEELVRATARIKLTSTPTWVNP